MTSLARTGVFKIFLIADRIDYICYVDVFNRDIHEYESSLDLLIFNCKFFWLPETRVFYRLGLYSSILWIFLENFWHLVITFLICFFFYIKLPKQSIVRFLLWSVFFIFFPGILNYWRNNQFDCLSSHNYN